MFDPSTLNLDEPDNNTKSDSASQTSINPENLNNIKHTEVKPTDTSLSKPPSQKIVSKNVDILAETEVYSPKENTKKAEEKVKNEKKIEQPELTSKAPKQVVLDVNITSLQAIIQLLTNNDYDFVTFEPDSEKVTVTFRENQTIADKKYIAYPTYSNILLKAKGAAKLKLDTTQVAQEGKSQIILDNKNYDILVKTVPGKNGEKLFFKTQVSKNQEKVKAKQKKSNLGQMLGFLGAILIVLLIIGSGFLSFVVLNAKTVEDVRFFSGLGINLADINGFIASTVTVSFSILIFIEFVLLVISLFRFILTKKEFKKRKIKYAILSAILFILSFSTAFAWKAIDDRVAMLPNWENRQLGDVRIYDHSKLLHPEFKDNALMRDFSSLIGPMKINFNLETLKDKERRKGLTIKKYIWDFDGEEIITTEPILIRDFDKKGITNISLTIEEVDAGGVVKQKEIQNLPIINISYLVDISYRPVDSGGRYVTFNAKDLRVLGEAQWYDLKNTETPVFKGEEYTTSHPITEETLMGLYMNNPSRTDKILDKVFIIEKETKKNLNAQIQLQQSKRNDLVYEFSAKNITIDNGTGSIETFTWIIDENEKTYSKDGVFDDLENSSTIEHTFKKYGKHEIKLILTDYAGNTQTVTKELNISKSLGLRAHLKVSAEGKSIDSLKYNAPEHEYTIDNLPIPTKLIFDARFVRAENPLFSLKNVSWDFNNDGDIDAKGKQTAHPILQEGEKTIRVMYEFQNKRIPEETVTLEEVIDIVSIKKDAIIDFSILKNRDYVPANVKLDASTSKVEGKNISKFIWDFGDGTPIQAGDAIIDGHYYKKDGDYDIKLTVVTSDGQRYSTTRKLILKPTPQDAKIKVSMKRAPAFQEIDFISSGSTGDIIGYFWDFGDGETSSKANPSHSYSKPGTYTVTLKLDYRNNNFKEATQKIEIQ